jgi:hypothetical protein
MRSIRERFHLLLLILAIPFVLLAVALICWGSIIMRTLEEALKEPEKIEPPYQQAS